MSTATTLTEADILEQVVAPHAGDFTPEAARGLGKSMRILKSEAKAMKEESNTAEPTAVHTTVSESPAATATEPPATAH